MLLLAAKTALAAGLSYWFAQLAGLQDGYWGSISAIIVMQSNVGSTVTASRDRLLGTLIGAGFGGLFSLVSAEFWAYLVAMITAMVTCSLLGLKNSSRLAGVTVTILMLVHRTAGSNWASWIMPLHRVLEVLLGIVVALGISTLVLPSKAKLRLRDGLAQEFLLMGAAFGAILEGFRGAKAGNLDQLWKDVNASFAANGMLLDAARNEPSGGPASLEALAMLVQLGHEIEDLLKALELAMQEREAGGYAAHLEPELGNLIADIQRGFEHVGASVHHWRFEDAQSDDVLEGDIAALEAKMASIRPTGLAFPQEEILRAYALQLHMKQLARLLQSARIETRRKTT